MNTTFLLLALLIGIFTGLRAFAPLAVVCLAAHWNLIPLGGTPLGFLGSIAAVIIVPLIAVGELVNDKLPFVGNRTAAPAFIGRILLAALCGLAFSFAARESWIAPAFAATVGAVGGTLGGFHFRRALVKNAGAPDFIVALLEDAIAVGGAILVISRIHH